MGEPLNVFHPARAIFSTPCKAIAPVAPAWAIFETAAVPPFMPIRAEATELAPRNIPMIIRGMAIYRVTIVNARGIMIASKTFPVIMIGPIASVEGENVLAVNPTIAFTSTHVNIT
jgi:hypothetical protein